MTNPTRPATGQVITTARGLSVADTVVRRYPNAATRYADLTGHTAADLLGQLCVLTDTGTLLQYAGPVLGWRKPWAEPWGEILYTTATSNFTSNAAIQDVVTITPGTAHPAGRIIEIESTTYLSLFSGQMSISVFHYMGAAQVGRTRIRLDAGELNGERVWTRSTSTGAAGKTSSAIQATTGVVCNVVAGDSPHTLLVRDIGPAVNPTALVDAGAGTTAVDVDLLTDEEHERWAAAVAPGE